jgi:uncharacterized protein YecE (DUF72 family)
MGEDRVEIRIGTSGYSYGWNDGTPTPFEWYVGQGFDTVEINASFYRFPSARWVDTWLRAPSGFTFSIKANRAITHYYKLTGKAKALWERFRKTLARMDDEIAFWLFQMPPGFGPSERNIAAIKLFLDGWKPQGQPVVEFRRSEWWGWREALVGTGAAFCSVNAPGLPRDMVVMGDAVYLRLHGKKTWYSYVYSEVELKDIVRRMERLGARRKYLYLNNDHGMLPNGLYLLKLRNALKRGKPNVRDE